MFLSKTISPPPISALVQPSLPSSFSLLSFSEFSVSVWAQDGWMESWQCLQMSHSMLVRLILLWREKLSEHTAIFVGLSSLTRRLLLRRPFMLQIITQRQRLFQPNVSSWETRRQTHTLVTSRSFVPFSRPIYTEMLELCSQWTTPKMQTQHHTLNTKAAAYMATVIY